MDTTTRPAPRCVAPLADASGPLCGAPTTAERTVEGLVCALCAAHAAELDEEPGAASADEKPGSYLVCGHGKADARWSADSSAVDDAADFARATVMGLLDRLHDAGYATRDGELLDDGWLVVALADTADLDRDPAVIAYCTAHAALVVRLRSLHAAELDADADAAVLDTAYAEGERFERAVGAAEDAGEEIEVELDSAVGPRVIYPDGLEDEVLDAAIPAGWRRSESEAVRTRGGRWSAPLVRDPVAERAAIVARLRSLRASTANSWELAVQTAEAHGPDPKRLASAECDREAALEAWDAAITAVEAGDMSAAAEALVGAQELAADWGDDAPERDALAALDEVAS